MSKFNYSLLILLKWMDGWMDRLGWCLPFLLIRLIAPSTIKSGRKNWSMSYEPNFKVVEQ